MHHDGGRARSLSPSNASRHRFRRPCERVDDKESLRHRGRTEPADEKCKSFRRCARNACHTLLPPSMTSAVDDERNGRTRSSEHPVHEPAGCGSPGRTGLRDRARSGRRSCPPPGNNRASARNRATIPARCARPSKAAIRASRAASETAGRPVRYGGHGLDRLGSFEQPQGAQRRVFPAAQGRCARIPRESRRQRRACEFGNMRILKCRLQHALLAEPRAQPVDEIGEGLRRPRPRAVFCEQMRLRFGARAFHLRRGETDHVETIPGFRPFSPSASIFSRNRRASVAASRCARPVPASIWRVAPSTRKKLATIFRAPSPWRSSSAQRSRERSAITASMSSRRAIPSAKRRSAM